MKEIIVHTSYRAVSPVTPSFSKYTLEEIVLNVIKLKDSFNYNDISTVPGLVMKVVYQFGVFKEEVEILVLSNCSHKTNNVQ